MRYITNKLGCYFFDVSYLIPIDNSHSTPSHLSIPRTTFLTVHGEKKVIRLFSRFIKKGFPKRGTSKLAEG